MAEEMGRRRLAVGPRDAHDLHTALGMPVKGRRDARHRLPRVGNDELRHGQRKFVFGHESGGAPPLRLARKQMPVRMRARKAEKEIALPHSAAVRAQRNDLRIPDQSLS